MTKCKCGSKPTTTNNMCTVHYWWESNTHRSLGSARSGQFHSSCFAIRQWGLAAVRFVSV